jgi:hypothetical protein
MERLKTVGSFTFVVLALAVMCVGYLVVSGLEYWAWGGGVSDRPRRRRGAS